MTIGNEAPIARRRRSLAPRVALAVVTMLLVALTAVWLNRKPIASGVIDRTLARAGVAARYRIVDLGLGRQRLVDVEVGDPAHPDLVADWIELGTRIGLDGAHVTAVRAGQVRARARLVDGRLSLGVIDRLLPAPTGKAFALPAIDLDVADARLRLETPLGIAGVRLSGQGRLDGGFRGRAAAVADRLAGDGCVADHAVAAVGIVVRSGRPTLRGPLRAAAAACGATSLSAPRGDVEVTLSETLDRWSGSATLAADRLRASRLGMAGLAGNLTFDGGLAGTRGSVALTSGAAIAEQGRAGGTAIAGSYAIGPEGPAFDGTARLEHAALPAPVIGRMGTLASASAGTPLAPLAQRAVASLQDAARDFYATADLR